MKCENCQAREENLDYGCILKNKKDAKALRCRKIEKTIEKELDDLIVLSMMDACNGKDPFNYEV